MNNSSLESRRLYLAALGSLEMCNSTINNSLIATAVTVNNTNTMMY